METKRLRGDDLPVDAQVESLKTLIRNIKVVPTLPLMIPDHFIPTSKIPSNDTKTVGDASDAQKPNPIQPLLQTSPGQERLEPVVKPQEEETDAAGIGEADIDSVDASDAQKPNPIQPLLQTSPGQERLEPMVKPQEEETDAAGIGEEDPDDDNNIPWGADHIDVGDHRISASDYFGSDAWRQMIMALHEVPPMDTPPGLTMIPHDYQLKGASQLYYLIQSVFKGGLCGDGMGMGKTLLAILLAHLMKDEVGPVLVVVPASLCRQWKRRILDAYDISHQKKILLLDDSSMSAHSIKAGNYDFVICSYEFVESSFRRMQGASKDISEYRADSTTASPPPRRPVCALHSQFWSIIKQPWKLVVLDEAQRVNKRTGKMHLALKALYAKAFVMLSGTLAHNRWHNTSGLVDFLAGHPFLTHAQFMSTFSTVAYDLSQTEPEELKRRLLQTFLLAFTIARPSSMLNLEKATRFRVSFELTGEDMDMVSYYTDKFLAGQRQEVQRRSGGAGRRKNQRNEDVDSEENSLANAVKAQMYSMAPALLQWSNVEHADPAEYVDDGEYDGEANDETRTENKAKDITPNLLRSEWLAQVNQEDSQLWRSPRVLQIVELYNWLRAEYPDESIVVYSAYLKFLDLIAIALLQEVGIKALRFDGTVSLKEREEVRAEFWTSTNPDIPMLVTAGAGGTGLELQKASIVIQSEVWWNANTESQAYSRVIRPGQKFKVKIYRLFASNSVIDHLILLKQQEKTKTIDSLMGRLVRPHDQPPEIPELAPGYGYAPISYSADIRNFEDN